MSDLFGAQEAPQESSGNPVDSQSGISIETKRLGEFLAGGRPDQALTNALSSRRLGSALLFYGPEGVGKWGAALRLAAFLNCDSPNAESALNGACGVCPACRQIHSGSFPDLLLAFPTPSAKSEKEALEIREEFLEQKRVEPFSIVRWDRVSGIAIERARYIKKQLGQRPNTGATRVVVFYEVQRMAAGVIDSLLRMIEEPPPNTVFILISSQPDAVAPTALSRCQRLRFPSFSLERTREFIAQRMDLTPVDQTTVARLAQGSPGRALELAAEIGDVDDEGDTDREICWLLFKSLAVETGPKAYDLLREHLNHFRSRAAVDSLINRWESYLRDLTLINQGVPDQIANSDLLAEMSRLADRIDLGDSYFHLLQKFNEVRRNLRVNVSPALTLADLSFAVARTLAA